MLLHWICSIDLWYFFVPPTPKYSNANTLYFSMYFLFISFLKDCADFFFNNKFWIGYTQVSEIMWKKKTNFIDVVGFDAKEHIEVATYNSIFIKQCNNIKITNKVVKNQ